MYPSRLKNLLFAIVTSLFAFSLMVYPKAAFESSLAGLKMWWEIVFPSLLPFFIISELLICFGVVRFVGVLMEPVMRPLFRVPGSGGFVWAMGISSGFPAGAKLTARLRQEKEISRIEAERLVAFTNCSNPLFILGAVAFGFFHNPELGVLLAAAHYIGNIFVGFIMRFYGPPESRPRHIFIPIPENRLMYALNRMYQVRKMDSRPFGQQLGDAVKHSIQTLLMIGGFILLFSVLNRMLTEFHITMFMASVLSTFTTLLGFAQVLIPPFLSGMFEITLGSKLISETSGPGLLDQAVLVSFVLAFNGFSVQAQVASILAETDIRFKPFLLARVLHGFIAAILTVILWKPLYLNQTNGTAVETFASHPSISWIYDTWHHLLTIGAFVTFISLVIFILMQLRSITQFKMM
ncbi:sporulation integral membrane protein YlbJ [Pseudalkalibacillus salsuginis]|uniref:sporulation integral membrane protein YlbJ n=1 Tax=Pseudalkalibacillus salsuginis TaxID=2910972 RepID=UPI001F38873C|nr:sporulation integral membrane protein YlbJ [Pseudalkalibacillus salsuginis]MCF6410447.1 sporulation integral membrane protein YlbJ [Pseudalkalibacillus salsuginis]